MSYPLKRRVTTFEVMLLVLGVVVLVVGFLLIRNTFIVTGGTVSWFMIGSIFSWLTLLILFVVSELNADVKEELSFVMREHVEQTRMLKEINHALLDEIKGMREDMRPKARIVSQAPLELSDAQPNVKRSPPQKSASVKKSVKKSTKKR